MRPFWCGTCKSADSVDVARRMDIDALVVNCHGQTIVFPGQAFEQWFRYNTNLIVVFEDTKPNELPPEMLQAPL